MRKFIYCFVVLLFLLIVGNTVLANTQTTYIPVTVRIPPMIIVELNSTELVFNEIDFDYILESANLTQAGVIATKRDAVKATISANVPYTLLISASEEYLVGDCDALIHISQLKWRLPSTNNPEPWESVTLERVPVQSGQPGMMEVIFDFQFIALWENPAQIYTSEILLTVVPEELDCSDSLKN